MSSNKHLADLMKVCSILPIFAVLPAMAGVGLEEVDILEYSDTSDMYNVTANGTVGGFSGYDASDRFEAAVVFVGAQKELFVSDGALIENNKAQVGGAIAITGNEGGATLNIGKDVGFLNNTALFDGGAIGNYGNTIVAEGVLFQGNIAQTAPTDNENQIGGGAISLGSTSKTTIIDTKFVNNKSGYNGGAIGTRLADRTDGNKNNNSTAILKISGSEFTGNQANGYKDENGKLVAGKGGAIYNTFYKDVVVENTEFENNYAAGNGGAIYNDGLLDLYNASLEDGSGKAGIMTIKDSDFEGNEAYYGGAIFNYYGKMDILGTEQERVTFEDNIAYVGGAFSDMQITSAAAGLVSETTIKHALFEENHAGADAGAAGFYGDVDIEDVIFRKNTAAIDVTGLKADLKNSDGGGAVQVGGTANVTMKDVYFVENESGARGGAIAARHGTQYTLDIDKATFTSNKSGNFGGGIANVYGGTVDMDTVSFVSNHATKAGGAIYNGKDMNYGVPSGVMSTNHGVLDFSGDNVFSGNSAGEFGGAIYNDEGGTINMAGMNTFSNNIAGKYAGLNDIHNLGTLNVLGGTTIIGGGITGNGKLTLAEGATLDIGTASIVQSSIDINGAVKAAVLSDKSFGRFVGDVTIGDSATLNLTVGSVGTYDIFDGASIDLSKINVGGTYDVSESADGIVISTKSVENLAAETGLSTQAAGAVAGLANSTNKTVQQISLLIQDALNSEDAAKVAMVEKEVAKLNPDDKPVAQAVSVSVQNQLATITAGRMSGVTSVGRAGGDTPKESGFWMQGLFNKSKYADQFHGYTRGFALGGDVVLNRVFTLGAGFSYGNTDVHASNSRDTAVDSNTLFVYGQYKPNQWYANATLMYTMSDYTEETDILGMPLTNDYDVDTYGAHVMTGYDFASGISAEIGARYMHVEQDAYSNGVSSVNALDTDFLSGVAGLKYAFTIESDWALKLRPELKAAATYDFISDDSMATVVMPGAAPYQVGGDRLSRLGGEFGIGLTALYKGMEISVMYDLDLHEDYTSQTGMLKFRGQF